MANKKKLEREAGLVRKLKKLYDRAQSDYCEVRGSEIHGRGVYATKDITKETEIIEYVGEPINKEVSEDRAWDQYARAEAWIIGRKIFIYSLQDIKAGEELTFDYGFDIECYEDHPCLCGRKGCIGYIVSQDQWPELRRRIAEKEAKASA